MSIIFTLTFVLCMHFGGQLQQRPERIFKASVGVVFSQHSTMEKEVLEHVMKEYQHFMFGMHVEYSLYADLINTADVYKLTRLVCHHLNRKVMVTIGAVMPDSFDTFRSFTNLYKVPFVIPWFPEKVNPQETAVKNLAFSLVPDYHRAVLDIIVMLGWKQVIFLYDSTAGLLLLEKLHKDMRPGEQMFEFTHVKPVNSSLDAVKFLEELEKISPWSNKYVLLDCKTQMARAVLIKHVQSPKLGRRNYHYFFSGLVMDDLENKTIPELGAINVTGFRVLDHSKKSVQNFLESLPKKVTSAHGALMYDVVQVLNSTIKAMIKQHPQMLRSEKFLQSKVGIECYVDYVIHPSSYGDTLAQVIKGTETEGLTGLIRFDKDGRRQNFSLEVVQMNSTGETSKIGTWYDNKEFVPYGPTSIITELDHYVKHKIYIIATIAEHPYVILEQTYTSDDDVPLLAGFCVDLTRLLMFKLDVSYILKLGKDNRYGTQNPDSIEGWDGLIGELIRREIDMVVAPLKILKEREDVVDFSIPFMMFNKHVKKTETLSWKSMLTFLNPMAMELWMAIFGCFLVTSLILSIVSRLESRQWSSKQQNRQGNTRNEHNVYEIDTDRLPPVRLNFKNAAWICIQKLFHQNTNQYSPRTIGVRIVLAVWMLFATFLTLLYIANLISMLTMKNIESPPEPEVIVTKCPKDKYTTPISQGEDGDHPSQGFIPGPNHEDEKCELLLSNITPGEQLYAIAFPKNSPLRKSINAALLELQKTGELEDLLRKWFLDTQCGTATTLHNEQLELNQVTGLFTIVLAAMILGFVTWVVEVMQSKWSKQRQEAVMMDRSEGDDADDDSGPSPPRRTKSILNSPSVELDMEHVDCTECCSELHQQEERQGPPSLEDIELGPIYDLSDRSGDEAEDPRAEQRRVRRAAPVELHWL